MALLYRMGTGNGSGGDLKPYIVQFTCDSGYIGQTLTMTYKGTPHAGETVDNVSGTVASDGTLTLYPMHSGNWECSCYSSVTGTTMKKTIELSYWGTTNVEFNDIPDGATVTPTDDVQTWLHCANIWNKTDLTTIDDVIADTATLNILISDNNASDYLARSTMWTSDVCNNESAMTYIGLNDYCANKLLADSTWLEAICSSAYFKKVLNKSVPTMTSNTGSDGGEASASSVENRYYAWLAFDKNTSTQGWSAAEATNAWIAYDFGKEVKVNAINIVPFIHASINRVKDFIIQGYNGNKWIDIYENTVPSATTLTEYSYSFANNESYSKYRLFVKNTYGTRGEHIIVNELQFYGRASS